MFASDDQSSDWKVWDIGTRSSTLLDDGGGDDDGVTINH